MKRFFLVFLAVFLCLAGTTAYADGTPQRVIDCRDSVVYIEIYSQEDAFLGSGSGFAIGEKNQPIQYIVTNNHVSGKADTHSLVYFGAYDALAASVVFTLPEADLCLLKLEIPTSQLEPLPLNLADPYSLTGEKVYALGFPGSAKALFQFSDHTASDVTITDGIVSAARQFVNVDNGPAVSALQMNASIAPGNSGGPLVDSKGTVLGINTFKSTTDTNMSGAIHVSELVPYLDQFSIPYMTGSGSPSSAVFLLSAVAAVVMAALIIGLIPRVRNSLRIRNSLTLEQYFQSHEPMTMEMALWVLDPVIQYVWEQAETRKSIVLVTEKNVHWSNGQTFYAPTRSSGAILSPEQLQGGMIGSWTAVYHFGALLYLVFTGSVLPHPLSRYEDDSQVQKNILATPIPELLQKALALKSADRMLSVSVLFESMALQKRPSAQSGRTRKKTDRKPLTRKKKLLTACIVCCLALLIALVGASAYAHSSITRAQTYIREYQFSSAYQALTLLPDFLHTDVRQLRKLAHCGELYQQKEYDAALEGLTALGGYSISAELAQKCRDEITKIEYDSLLKTLEDALTDGDLTAAQASLLTYQYGASSITADSEILISEEQFKQSQYDYAGLLTAHEYYQQAMDVLETIMTYKDASDLFYSAVIRRAAALMDEGDLLNAIQLLDTYKNKEALVKESYDRMVPSVYQQGKAYMDAGKEASALSCFKAISSYKDSATFIQILESDDVFFLIQYLQYSSVKEKVYSQSMMQEYLQGKWTGGQYYFSMDEDGSASYNVPWFDNGDYYRIDQGIYYVYPENKEVQRKPLYKFTIQSRDVVSIYSYQSDETYRLKRE